VSRECLHMLSADAHVPFTFPGVFFPKLLPCCPSFVPLAVLWISFHVVSSTQHQQGLFSPLRTSKYIPPLHQLRFKENPHDVLLNSTKRLRQPQVLAVKGKLRRTVSVSTWIVLRSLVGLDKDKIPNNSMLWVMRVSRFHIRKSAVRKLH
jgi:hypothetical protein